MLDTLPNTNAHIPAGALPTYASEPAFLAVTNTGKPWAEHLASFMRVTPEHARTLNPALLDIAIPLGARGTHRALPTYTQILILPRTFADRFRSIFYLHGEDDANRQIAFWSWSNDNVDRTRIQQLPLLAGHNAAERLNLTVAQVHELLNPAEGTPAITPEQLDALTILITLDLLNEPSNQSPSSTALLRIAHTLERTIHAAADTLLAPMHQQVDQATQTVPA